MRSVLLKIFIGLCFVCVPLSNVLAQDKVKLYIAPTSPFENLQGIKSSLISAGKAFAKEYPNKQALLEARKNLFEQNITTPNLTPIEKSILLEQGAMVDRENGNYRASADKLLEIFKYGALPKERMMNALKDLKDMAYGYGNFDLAAEAFSQSVELGYTLRPWDDAMLAEIMLRSNRPDLALIRLSSAIDILKENGCPIQPKWQNMQTALKENDTASLQIIKDQTTPYMLSPLRVGEIKPIKRIPARYPPRALRYGISGHAHMGIILNSEGIPVCSFPLSDVKGSWSFVKASKDAIKKYRYDPSDLGDGAWVYGIEYVMSFSIRK